MHCYHHASAQATTLCKVCSCALCDDCASKHERSCHHRLQPARVSTSHAQRCAEHSFEPARGLCIRCQRPVCWLCGEMVNGQVACSTCQSLLSVQSYGTLQWAQSGLPGSRFVNRPVLFARLAAVAAVAVVLALAAVMVGGSMLSPGRADALTGASGDSSPAEVVRRHYSLLAAHDNQTAWQLLSPSLQAQFSYQAWANSYTWLRIEPIALEVVSRKSAAATVVGTVAVHEGDDIARTSQGYWTLVLLDGGWRLDSSSVGGPTPSATATPSASASVSTTRSEPALPMESEVATPPTPPAAAMGVPDEAHNLSVVIEASPTPEAKRPAATPSATKSATPTAVSKGSTTATVSSGGSERVRLRRGPSTSYGVIVNLTNGTKVTVLKAVTGESVGSGSSRWYYVSWRDGSGALGCGYVYGSFVKLAR